jgi:hypothetical protein
MGAIDNAIEVKESVYKAAEAFDGLVFGEGFLLAKPMVNWFRAKKDKQKEADFWKAIWDYLREKEFSASGTRILVEVETDFQDDSRRG